MKVSFPNHLKRWLLRQFQPNQAGFTLIEVLIAALIGSIIISSLLWLLVNLVGTERRESALNETERDMKRALDYIVADLKEAVYIYDGSCEGYGTTATTDDVCPPYYYGGNKANRFLPSWVADNNVYPVLAFWKTDDVDVDTQVSTCSTYASNLSYECTDLKKRRHVYSLVVYTQDKDPTNTWAGESVIERFELSRYDDLPSLTPNAGYVDPTITGVSILPTWPFTELSGKPCNLQSVTTTSGTAGCTSSGTGALVNPYATAVNGAKVPNRVLTDFVDQPDADGPDPTCGTGYRLTPRDTSGNALSRTFYACIRSADQVGQNQDLTIFLRGNANGRSGISQDLTTAVLQTRVTLRGVLDKSP